MLLEISAIAGLVGVGLSIIAYLPQIVHLIRERCSAGVSAPAFGIWLISSILVTFHAAMILDMVFLVLGCVQIITSLLIFVFGIKYKDGVCASHAAAACESVHSQ